MQLKGLLDVSIINDKTVSEFENTKRYVATGGVEYNRIINFEEVTYDNKPSRANREVELGDILIAKMKDTVKVVRITEDNCAEYIFSTGFCTLKAKTDILNNDYFYRVLTSEYFQNQKDKYSKGATQKAINNTGLKKIKIPVPPINIQKQIVEVLDEAQSLIDNRKEQIKLLDDLIESVFYDMFGDPVSNNKGWEVKRLGELGNFKNGMNYAREDSGYSIKCLGVGDFKNLLEINDVRKLSQLELNSEPKEDYLLKNGDIVFVRSNGNKKLVGRNIAIYPGNELVVFSGFCIRLRITSDNIISKFLNFVLQTKTLRDQLFKNIRGANIQNLNQKMLYNLEIPIPPIHLQDKFAEKAEQIQFQKQLLEGSLKLLENNYNSLIQRAFKGELFN